MSMVQSEGAYSPPASRYGGDGMFSTAVLAAGAFVVLRGISRASLPGLLMTGVGGALLFRGAAGRAGIRGVLGVRDERTTAQIEEAIDERGIEVVQTFLVNRTPEELYAQWRDLRNLPRIMTYLSDVQVLDERRSRWIAKAPLVAGGSVEWDAEITRDEPSRAIGWHSLPGSQIDTAGEVRFRPALGDRGTEVHVTLSYLPPAGRVGHWLATILGKAPRRTIREDLRNFKRMMEVGEILTTTGQPQGTCLQRSRRTARAGS